MARPLNVLVFPCGSEPGSEIHQALRYSLHARLFGASSVDDHGRLLYAPDYHVLPSIHEDRFGDAFAALLRTLRIDLVFSTHDTVAVHLAGLAGELGFALVNGDQEANRVARSKRATYALFADQPWAPRVYDDPRVCPEWPIVAKPDAGQGGQGFQVLRTPAEADMAWRASPAVVFVEHLPGEELTVDCFTDRHRALVHVGPRTRERVRGGISMRSRPVPPEPGLMAIATVVNQRLVLRGPWYFQVKRAADGRWKLLEISTRLGGASVAQRARGVNLPLLAVLDHAGVDVVAKPEPRVRSVDRRIQTLAELDFTFDTVYIDFDDTLVSNGRALPVPVAFVYQMIALGKRIVLLTRHAHDLAAMMQQARLSPALFDQIIHITDGTPKGNHVTPGAIFVDNHFPERREVAERHGIPTFDVDALEFLLR